jgi:hypothetical protein
VNNESTRSDTDTTTYEAPALTELGTIEEWTHGYGALIDISLIIG